jgi:myo-inositol-1(or 4)-monophosphatase
MDKQLLDRVAAVGRQAALAAGAVLRQNYHKPHRITYKGAIDPVTESDIQSQEMIIALIRQTFPGHGFLAEEKTGEGQEKQPRPAPAIPARAEDTPAYRWIIDPLDGTVNFAHGFPAFCVSIGWEAAGTMQYGVIYDPLRDELFEARKGGGAFLNGQHISVSKIERLDRALLTTGFPYDIRERLGETLARLGRVLGVAQGVRRAGSAALDLAYVACGRFDGFWEENLKPWDTAAGVLIIEEAGGRITTFSGEDYDIYGPNILSSNGKLHNSMLALMRI